MLAGQRPRDRRRDPGRGRALRRDPRRDPARSASAACPRSRCATPASPRMTVAENMAFRTLRRCRPSRAASWWLQRARHARRGPRADRALQVKTASPGRADRRRCRAATSSAPCWRASCPATSTLLIVANPCFGLDFAAVAEIRSQIMRGAQPRRGRAAGQRGPRRDSGAGRPHPGDVRRQDLVYETPTARCRPARIGAAHGGALSALDAAQEMLTIAASPSPFAFDAGRTALVVIDMQRDFVEPGGFGEALGNDVARLAGDRARRCGG